MEYTIETEKEVDGRWIAEIPDLPGVLAYGETKKEAIEKAEALALRVLGEGIECHECRPMLYDYFSQAGEGHESVDIEFAVSAQREVIDRNE